MKLKRWQKLGASVVLFSVLLSNFASAQPQKNGHYIFPEFEKAVVYLKSGVSETIDLNYNTITEEMVFVKNGAFLAMDNLKDIERVEIGDRLFIPVSNVFYEQLSDGGIPLLMRHKSKLLMKGKSTELGSTQASAVDNISNISSSGKVYNLEIGAEYGLIHEDSFFISKGDKFLPFNNMKEAGRAFPDKAQQIKHYKSNQKVRFGNQNDVTELLKYLVK